MKLHSRKKLNDRILIGLDGEFVVPCLWGGTDSALNFVAET